jgi:protein-disulfide isomerase
MAVGLGACSRSAGRPGDPPTGGASTPPGTPGGGVVAEVNGAPVLASELNARASSSLARLRQEEYEIRRRALDEIVEERLLDAEASKRGISREELLQREVEAKTPPASAAEIERIYDQNKTRFAGQPKQQALARIGEILGRRAKAERHDAYLETLRSRAQVAVHLQVPRIPVEIPKDAPAQGPASAPVTIVEFTDYQCPFCHRAQGVMDRILSRYRGKVRLVHLDFPLQGHPGAFPAARASRCAGEQGKFWEYDHDLMTQPGSLDDADLKGRAARVGLRPESFASCLGSGRHDASIRASFEQGEAVGVSGTPGYFVNGRMIAGALPYEEFARVIDEELQGR